MIRHAHAQLFLRYQQTESNSKGLEKKKSYLHMFLIMILNSDFLKIHITCENSPQLGEIAYRSNVTLTWISREF